MPPPEEYPFKFHTRLPHSPMKIYELRRYGKIAFFISAILVVGIFLRISSNIVSDLSSQERERMKLWADATRRLTDPDLSDNDIDFLFKVIQNNTTIPVLIADEQGNIIEHLNFDLPVPENPDDRQNKEFLHKQFLKLSQGTNVIIIQISPGYNQYLYYEDSKLLKRLSFFPYLQLIIMLVFVTVIYFAVTSAKRAEQNKVWVGLSKETAHQLGTPISSLMAWMELLRSMGIDEDIVSEMNKDVDRLSTIASRFSKIGSRPEMEIVDINDVCTHAAQYMQARISQNIKINVHLWGEPLPCSLSRPLIEWVLENLIKNAVDAMEGKGSIAISTAFDGTEVVIDVADTGKGIPRKHQKNVFNPGYTTKKRGWGLGLTLARRIIDQYHHGKIFVYRSEPDVGTTFRITLPEATTAIADKTS